MPTTNSARAKVSVTGGTGFIGSHLIPELLSKGYDVWSLERYVTGRVGTTHNVKTVFADLNDSFTVRKAIRTIQPNVVIHLAAFSAVSYSYDHPQEVLENNLIGTVNLAESCLREGHAFQHFLFAGTSEEYGNNGYEIQSESNPLMPASPYGISKTACDNYLEYLKEAHDFPATVLRPFNTYGRKTDCHFLIEKAINQMLKGRCAKAEFIDPNPIRDWLYVADHVNAYLTCLEKTKAIGETFNFCTGHGYTVKDTVEKIADLTEFNGEIVWGTAPQRPTESEVIIGNYQKANKLLGWEPKYTLENGLVETIEWWKNQLRVGREPKYTLENGLVETIRWRKNQLRK